MDLNGEFKKRLSTIESLVKSLWKPHTLSPYFFTPHDPSHSEGVIRNLSKLIPNHENIPNDLQFSNEEIFYLLCAAWLHDIGMIPNLFQNEPTSVNKRRYLQIREEHHIRSQKFVESKFEYLGLSKEEAQIIGELCKLHRRREDINSELNIPNVRVKLLGAYLRIADSLHIDSTRVDTYKALYNLFLSDGMPLSSEFHWLRSIWIRDIEASISESALKINFNLSESDNIDDIDYLCKITIDDIAEEIASCNDILIKGGISQFIDVKYEFNNLKADDEKKAKLKQIISKLKIQHTASSSQLANIMMDTVMYIAKYYANNEEDALQMIEKYCYSEIDEIKRERPCHVLVKYVEGIVNNAISQTSLDTRKKLDVIIGKIKNVQEERKNNLNMLSKYAKSFIADCSPMLLFGYSSIIIKVLDDIEDEDIRKNTPIYILECRSKNQFNFKNDIIYCDGFRYAKHLSQKGFKKIYLVPDIISGNLILERKVNKILFGANTVDFKNMVVGHTAGHVTLIHSAIHYDVPIYVFADSYKFGVLCNDLENERKTDWFTGSAGLKKEIAEMGIGYYNPRSDVIPLKYVHTFITDVGTFPPTQIPEKLKRKVMSIERILGT